MKKSIKETRLPYEEAAARLHYDKDTGAFLWKTPEGGVRVGEAAGYVNASGYMVVGLLGEKYRLHRLAILLTQGEWPAGVVDHINGNKLDNRLVNLRCVSQAVNAQNRHLPSKANTSGYLGVYWSGRRGGWMASISLMGGQKRRGPYKTSERAFEAYVEMKRRHHEGCTL